MTTDSLESLFEKYLQAKAINDAFQVKLRLAREQLASADTDLQEAKIALLDATDLRGGGCKHYRYDGKVFRLENAKGYHTDERFSIEHIEVASVD